MPLKNLSRREKIQGMCNVLIRALNLKNLEVVSAIIAAQASRIHRSYISRTGMWVVAKSLEEIGNPAVFGGSLISYICAMCYRNGWVKLAETYSALIQKLQEPYLVKDIHEHKCACALCLLALTACNSPKIFLK